MTKYNFDFSIEVIEVEVRRLTNQIWKLIPMKENEEDYQKQLDTVIIEIAGLGEIYPQDSHFLQALAKLEGLRVQEVDFWNYRKTVFETINLIQEFKHEQRKT